MKRTLYFFQEQWSYELEPRVRIWDIKLDNETSPSLTRIFLGEAKVDLPDFHLKPQAELNQRIIKGLRTEIQQIQAKAHEQVQRLEERIQQLQCLEYKEANENQKETAHGNGEM